MMETLSQLVLKPMDTGKHIAKATAELKTKYIVSVVPNNDSVRLDILKAAIRMAKFKQTMVRKKVKT